MKRYVFRKKRNIVFATALDAVGYSVRRLLRPFFPKPTSSPATLLIVRLDHLGDVLPASALPKILKENLPAPRILFLTSSWGAALLENNPFVDEVLVYDAPWFAARRYTRSSRSFSFAALPGELARRKIDTALAPRGDLRENFLMAVAGIPRRLGYGVTGGGFFLTDEIRYRSGAHESEHTLDILRALGIQGARLEPRLYFSQAEIAAFEKRRLEWGVGELRRSVGFFPASGSAAKDWPAERTSEFLSAFKRRFPERPLLLLGSDAGKIRILDPAAREGCLDLTGKTTLRELFLLLSGLGLVVGPDTGPVHVAAALGRPTLFLYSGTNDFNQWKPLAESAVVLRDIQRISSQELLEAVSKELARDEK